jgi:hypothetical protein
MEVDEVSAIVRSVATDIVKEAKQGLGPDWDVLVIVMPAVIIDGSDEAIPMGTASSASAEHTNIMLTAVLAPEKPAIWTPEGIVH